MSGKTMRIREGTIIKESNAASHCQSTNLCNAQHQNNKVNCCKGDIDELKTQLDREKQKRWFDYINLLKNLFKAFTVRCPLGLILSILLTITTLLSRWFQ